MVSVFPRVCCYGMAVVCAVLVHLSPACVARAPAHPSAHCVSIAVV